MRGLVLALLLGAPLSRADAQPPAPPPPATAEDTDELTAPPETDPDGVPELTGEIWRPPKTPLEPHRYLLVLPEALVEVAFTPIIFLVELVERRRLDELTDQALSNRRNTIAISPQVRASFGDGFGAGAVAEFEELLEGDGELAFEALARLNRDFEVGLGYAQTLPRLEGRMFDAQAVLEVDRDQDYYGIGNDTAEEDRHVLRWQALTVGAGIDLRGQGLDDFNGRVEVLYSRQSLEEGELTGEPNLTPDSDIELPPGFLVTRDYAEVDLVALYDSRDTAGLPTRGLFAELRGGLTTDLEGAGLRAAFASLLFQTYRQVLPRRRTLVLTGGMAATTPLFGDAQVPYHRLVTLGQRTFLRGYDKGRFRDELGWWANVEYRWPIWEYKQTGVGLHGGVFADVGRVGESFTDLFGTDIRYSYGFSIRGAHETRLLVRLEVGFSPEGSELSLSLGRRL